MRLIRRGLLATLPVALALGVLGGPVAAGSGSTYYVDGDGQAGNGGGCASGVAFTSIQDAIDFSGPGDTVVVCPGSYEEQLAIGPGKNRLTVTAHKFWKATVLAPFLLDGESIVSIEGVNRVQLQGFKIKARGGEESCDPVFAAISLSDTVGTVVNSNRISTRGPDTLGLCGYAIGVAVGDAALSPTGSPQAVFAPPPARVTVRHNVVRDFITAGVVAGGPGVEADILRNSVRYLHLAYEGSTVAGSLDAGSLSAARGLLDRASRRGIRATLDGGVGPAGEDGFAFGILLGHGSLAHGNNVYSGPDALGDFSTVVAPGGVPPSGPATPLLLAGILALGDEGPLSTSGISVDPEPVEVSRNHVFRALAGVALLFADEAIVRDNTIDTSLLGFIAMLTSDASIKRNEVTENVFGMGISDDLFDDDVSQGNLVQNNDVEGNFIQSCFDDTGDDALAGITNDWVSNQAEAGSSSPAGICGAADPF